MPMYTYSDAPKPLRTGEFYILLALARRPMHAYLLMGEAQKDSLGGVVIKPGKLYPLVTRLHEEGLIDMIGRGPAGKSGKDRMYYAISPYSTLRLKEECQRLNYAVGIAKSAGLLEQDEVPFDIQRLMLNLKTAPEKGSGF